MSKNIKCIGCAFADWNKTKTGRLSPDGMGRCRWSEPIKIVIPASMYFFGISSGLKPSGGSISRKPSKFGNDIIECPTFKAIEVEP